MGLDGPLPRVIPNTPTTKYRPGRHVHPEQLTTSPGAFGYILSQIQPKPRLTVATHFPVADDTVTSAFESVKGTAPTSRWAAISSGRST